MVDLRSDISLDKLKKDNNAQNNSVMKKGKYESFCEKLMVPIYSKSWWLDAVCQPENWDVWLYEDNGKVIAASIMLMANSRMNYHLSGSLREFGSLAPTNLLLYQAALWGNVNGYKTFYLGGGVGSGEDCLFKFKRSFFKGDLKKFYIGNKIYNVERYNELIAM